MDAAALADFERCAKVFCSSNAKPEEYEAANARLMVLGEDVKYLPQCQYVINSSTCWEALYVATGALKEMMTKHWPAFSVKQRVEIRNYLITYLAKNGPNLQKLVVKQMVSLVCRITKKAWFDNVDQIRQIVPEALKFLQSSESRHTLIGLHLLRVLVDEMNHPVHKRTLSEHRRVAISFREIGLLQTFDIALNVLRQLYNGNVPLPDDGVHADILQDVAELAAQCLNYDFLGTNAAETVEEYGTIHVPTTWRSRIQDQGTMRLLFDSYRVACAGGPTPDGKGYVTGAGPASPHLPAAARLLDVLHQLISVRRSLFLTEDDRSAFLRELVGGTLMVLKEGVGLNNEECYHRFCRLLGRMKKNFQLTELLSADGYTEWIEEVATFSMNSFNSFRWSSNSIHYILALWTGLVAAMPYVRNKTSAQPRLHNLAPKIVEAYVKARMKQCEEAAVDKESVDEDPLDNPGMLEEEVEAMAGVFRYQFDEIARAMCTVMDPQLKRFCDISSKAAAEGTPPPDVAAEMQRLEGSLAWLTYIIGAVVSAQSFGYSGGSEEHLVDAGLCKRVLTLMQEVNERQMKTQGALRGDPHLDQALVYFISCFRRTFLSEQHGMPPPGSRVVRRDDSGMGDGDSGDMSTGGGGVHIEPSKVIPRSGSGSGGSRGPSSIIADDGEADTGFLDDETGPEFTPATPKQKMFQQVFDAINMGSHTDVATLMITKLANNLRVWHDEPDVIKCTLEMWEELSQTYSSGKLLLSLGAVKYLLQNHTEEHFRFLTVPELGRQRTQFYHSLSRVVYLEDAPDRFEAFMAPLLDKAKHLSTVASSKAPDVAFSLVGLARDLRGIVTAAYNKRTYTWFFEAVFPEVIEFLINAAGLYADDPEVLAPILKFLCEFSFNRAARIYFNNTSAYGILLFRQISRLLADLAPRVAKMKPPRPQDVDYDAFLKPAYVLLQTLGNALDGNYTNFGVFALYNDKALDVALESGLRLLLSIPRIGIEQHEKVARAVFFLLKCVFRGHMEYVVGLPPDTFQQLLGCLRMGLDHLDGEASHSAAVALESVASFYVRNSRKDSVAANGLREQIARSPTVFLELSIHLFNIIVFGFVQNQNAELWALASPQLALLLASTMSHEKAFEEFSKRIVEEQPQEHREPVKEVLSTLMTGITKTLDAVNKDRFLRRLADVRQRLQEQLKLG